MSDVFIAFGLSKKIVRMYLHTTLFARSETGIVGSNPTQGMDVWCLCVYVRFSMFVYR
jgi:hypothetical protein